MFCQTEVSDISEISEIFRNFLKSTWLRFRRLKFKGLDAAYTISIMLNSQPPKMQIVWAKSINLSPGTFKNGHVINGPSSTGGMEAYDRLEKVCRTLLDFKHPVAVLWILPFDGNFLQFSHFQVRVSWEQP